MIGVVIGLLAVVFALISISIGLHRIATALEQDYHGQGHGD